MTERRGFAGRPRPRLAVSPALLLMMIAAAALMVAAAMVIFLNTSGPEPRFEVTAASQESGGRPDTSKSELARCRSLPPGASDARCEALWEQGRRAFFDGN